MAWPGILQRYTQRADDIHLYDMLGDNDRAAMVLFVQHPSEQGEWCSQNPRVVLT